MEPEERPETSGADPSPKRKRKRKRKVPDESRSEEAEKSLTDNREGGANCANTTVYVEGISFDADEEDLKILFEQAGTVEEVRMPRWQDSGKPRGYAHVVFGSAAHAAAAIKQIHRQRLMGRYLTVDMARPPKKSSAPAASDGSVAAVPEGCTTVFVKNLPYDCDEDGVGRAMARFGEVTDVRLAMWNTNPPRLKVYACFRSPACFCPRADALRGLTLVPWLCH